MENTKNNIFTRIVKFCNKYNLIRILMLLVPLFLFDYILRCVTHDANYLPADSLVPNLFTLFFIIAAVSIFLLLPRTLGRVFYGIFYYIFGLYAFVQAVYFMMFGNIIFLQNIALAGEGAAYTEYVLNALTPVTIILLLLYLCYGAVCIIFFPKPNYSLAPMITKGAVSVVCIVGIILLPNALGEEPEGLTWDLWKNPRYIYNNTTNAHGSLETAGLYQYTTKNLVKIIEKAFFNGADTEKIAAIDEYASERTEEADNEMTDIFKGKNVIFFLLESVDDWLINETDTPTMWHMMQNGINFTNFYTPMYGVGATFNTEFSFNTGFFTLSDSSAYALQTNSYPYSAAHLFGKLGYSAMSFHYNDASFYGRNSLHQSLGYTRYVSFKEYETDYNILCDDTMLAENDEIYNLLTKRSEDPLMSFVITYSGHLDYVYTNNAAVAGLEKYPEYRDENRSEEFNCIKAQTRLTDDMFTKLIERLREDGELENTVFVGFTDHYTYGIKDVDTLWQYADADGSHFLEKTPFFIYAEGIEPQTVTKPCDAVDILPTVANMFGLEKCDAWIGNDIFSDSYDGFAFFPDGSWVTDHIIYKSGEVVYDDGKSEYSVSELNDRTAKLQIIDEYILNTDYFHIKQ